MNREVLQFLDHLAYERGLATNTRTAYAADLRAFFDYVGQDADIVSAYAVRRPHIVGFLAAEKGRGLSATTLARRLVTLKVFFGWLQAEGVLDDNPAEALAAPRLWKQLPDTMTPEAVAQLIAAADGESHLAHRDHAMLELLYACGLRVSELADLKLEDVYLDEGFIRCIGKGDRQRVVPLGCTATESLRRYLRKARSALIKESVNEHLFLSYRGHRLTRQTIWRLVGRYARATIAGDHVHPHMLRHCFASHLLANGAQLSAIQEMLGHVDIATTQIYTHVDTQRLRSVHQRFHPRS